MIERNDAALIGHLNRAGIPYVVIGGWAVVTHGYVRATKDIDVIVPESPEVASALAAALAEIHAETLHGKLIHSDTPLPEHGWQVMTDFGRIDVLLEGAPPLDFRSLRENAIETELDGEPVIVADLVHLVALKRLAGRPQDHADLAELEALYGPLAKLALPGMGMV